MGATQKAAQPAPSMVSMEQSGSSNEHKGQAASSLLPPVPSGADEAVEAVEGAGNSALSDAAPAAMEVVTPNAPAAPAAPVVDPAVSKLELNIQEKEQQLASIKNPLVKKKTKLAIARMKTELAALRKASA